MPHVVVSLARAIVFGDAVEHYFLDPCIQQINHWGLAIVWKLWILGLAYTDGIIHLLPIKLETSLGTCLMKTNSLKYCICQQMENLGNITCVPSKDSYASHVFCVLIMSHVYLCRICAPGPTHILNLMGHGFQGDVSRCPGRNSFLIFAHAYKARLLSHVRHIKVFIRCACSACWSIVDDRLCT